MAGVMPRLRIRAQPKTSYRPRYMCEGRPCRNRAQRFVRADDNPDKYDYPTIEIPTEWIRELKQPIYIRLTHVTVPNAAAGVRCVHPYPIDTEDAHVIKDPTINSLFFPVSQDELESARKTFQFSLYKLTQYQLRTYGSLQVLDANKADEQRLEDSTDPRKIIDLYQLAKSQLVFSIAVFENNQAVPIIYDVSSVFSKVMTATTVQANDDEMSIRCSPQRGDAQGGEEILMVIPKVDKRKQFSVRFDHPSMNQRSTVNMVFVDTKTILFYSPPCPVLLTRENPSFTVPIVVTQNDIELARIDFVYQSMDTCLNCNGRKRSLAEVEEEEDDGVQFNVITPNGMHNDQFDLSHIKNFITTTRTSTTNNIDQFSQLENAIQQGDIDLAVRMLKRTKLFLENTNDRGETPLLIAAKCNQNKLIVAILKKHSKYAEQVDQKGNNLIHLLANIPENEAATTIDNVFVLLDEQLKEQLMLGRNQFGQTPDDIARRRGNMKYINMFSRQISSSDSN